MVFVGWIILCQTGCLAVGIGTAAAGGAVGYAYYRGAVQRAYPVTVNAASRATQDALAKLGMPMTHGTHSAKESTLYFRQGQANGTRIRIWLEQESPPNPGDGVLTVITVRVGTFGDMELSERILDEIARHLSLPSEPGGAAPGRIVPLPVDDPRSRTPKPPDGFVPQEGVEKPVVIAPSDAPSSRPPPLQSQEPPATGGRALPSANAGPINPVSGGVDSGGRLVPIPVNPPPVVGQEGGGRLVPIPTGPPGA